MTPLLAATFLHWLWIAVRRFGAFVFFPLGLLDMSPIPAPGSFDALLIVLTAAHKELWWYYALMATAGSVFGAWPTFELARKGGEEALDKRLGASRSKIDSIFQRWGFWSLFVGAVAPPPAPAAAFIMIAGALRYPWHRFLVSWTLGRLVRFGLIAWVIERYGANIFNWLRGYYGPALWILISIGIAGGAVAVWFYIRKRRSMKNQDQPEHRAA